MAVTGPNGPAWSPNEGDAWFNLTGVVDYWCVHDSARWLAGGNERPHFEGQLLTEMSVKRTRSQIIKTDRCRTRCGACWRGLTLPSLC